MALQMRNTLWAKLGRPRRLLVVVTSAMSHSAVYTALRAPIAAPISALFSYSNILYIGYWGHPELPG